MFKVNDYLTTIDNRLGSPINTFYYTAKYSMQEVDAVERRNRNFLANIWHSMKTNFVLFC